jgi:hypothetical protein
MRTTVQLRPGPRTERPLWAVAVSAPPAPAVCHPAMSGGFVGVGPRGMVRGTFFSSGG